MKPFYAEDFKRRKGLYNYLNKLYKKGQIDAHLARLSDSEEIPQNEKRKINRKKARLTEEFKHIDVAKTRQIALFFMNEGIITSELDSIFLSSKNEGYKAIISKVLDLIKEDQELAKLEAQNREELNKKVNLADASNDFKSQLKEFLDEETIDEILGKLKEIAVDIRKGFIVGQQNRKYDLNKILIERRYNLNIAKRRIIYDKKIENIAEDKLDILDNVMAKALDSYLDAQLSFDELDKQKIEQNAIGSISEYKVSKLSHINFMNVEKYGINDFLYSYMFNEGYNIAEFNGFVYDFYNRVLNDNDMTSKEKFDEFVLGFTKNIFSRHEHNSISGEENAENIEKLVDVFNKMAEEKGISKIEFKEIQASDIKNYFYNVFGSQYIADDFKEFEQNRIPYQKLNDGQVDTIHAEFQNKMALYNEHMEQMKALQNTKPEKSFSIDMEVYRKNYNYLKEIHESRGFFKKIFNLGTHREEERALKAYAKTFKEAFNIVGSENDKKVTTMLNSKTSLIKDGKNIRFVSTSEYVDFRTDKKAYDSFVKVFEDKNLDKEQKLVDDDNLLKKEELNEERTSIIVDEINKNNNKDVIENKEALVDFRLENDHYKITQQKYDEIMDYINNPAGMSEREPGDYDPGYIRTNYLKDCEVVKDKEPQLVKDKEANK